MVFDSSLNEFCLRGRGVATLDHAKDILTAIAQDLKAEQSAEEQSEKSKGHGAANVMAASGRLHAEGRIEHGFTPGRDITECCGSAE